MKAVLCAAAFAAFLLPSLTHAQVFKCPDANGRLALQQTPCAGGARLDVRPASGHAPTAAAAPAAATAAALPPATAPAAPKSYTQQLEDERLARERWTKWNDAMMVVDRERAQCEREQRAIESEMRSSANNLAGATRDNAIAQRMKAAAEMCQMRVAADQRTADGFKADCDRLGCRRPGQ